MDGEIDPARFAAMARRRGKSLWLPVLQAVPAGTLRFARWQKGSRMHRNRFGIPEPAGVRLPVTSLDLVLLPLVGFDQAGGRLGMGGGFYDRTLAFKARQPARQPRLIGLAHACQQVDSLERAGWDIGLDAVVTDRRWYAAAQRKVVV